MSLLNNLMYPWVLILIIPLLIFLIVIVLIDIFKVKTRSSPRLRLIFIITRIIVIICLLIALAGPFVMEENFVQGDPKVKILVDNSTSFSIFDSSAVDKLIANLKDKVDVDVAYIVNGERSAIGDGVLSNLQKNDNVLLVSDGHNNYGSSLGDVGLFANNLNASVSALKMEPIQSDAAVRILGPDKTAANVNNDFKVIIERSSGMKSIPLIVRVDGEIVYNQETTKSEYIFSKTFTEGYHKVEAKILWEDYFLQNNQYYKIVKVVPKPKALLVTANPSPLQQLFNSVYDLNVVNAVPADLNNYAVVIINNMDASNVENIDSLTNFVADGNGLVVVGGTNSYDSGGYKNSQFEQLLPVYVAKAGKKGGDVNIVVIVDTSGSTSTNFLGEKAVDIEKAMAVDILKGFALIHKVGVVAFKTESFEVAPIDTLMNQEEDILTKIAMLRGFGGTKLDVGIMKALEMLSTVGGSKNIIIITDGKTQGYDEALAAAKRCGDMGVKLYTVGIGIGTNRELLSLMADLGNGAYFEPQNREGLKILFGNSLESRDKKDWALSVINADHFITDGIKLKSTIYGYNIVVPKGATKLLITTDTGEPIVSAWRFGLGRVVSVTTDDGSLYAPDLLGEQNSRLWTRIVNYGVGDPERKVSNFVDVYDARVNSEVEVIVKFPTHPDSEDISFVQLDENIYSGSQFFDTIGFTKVMGADVAVNSPIEYERVGLNSELQNIVLMSGGKMFEQDDIDEIVAFIEAKSRRIELEKKSLAWPFALIALLVFCGEICARRLLRNQGLI